MKEKEMKERKEMNKEGKKIWKKSNIDYKRQIQQSSVDRDLETGI